MIQSKFGLILTTASLLLGCAHKTPVTDGVEAKFCDFKRYHLNLKHRNGVLGASSNLQSLNAVLTDGFMTNSSKPIPKDDMLFMSGGNINGAFGAGVLAGWSHKNGCPEITVETQPGQTGCLPDFSIVTGVSTGAILSLAAFTNIPKAAIDGYDVESELQAIYPFVRRDKNGKLKKTSYLTALRKGALADISPLKETIHEIAAEHGVFHAIAKRGYENRLLLAGVVDVDTGEALALDMTDMAKKIYNADPNFVFNKEESIVELTKRNEDVGHYVDCFTRAIAASSSVPLAALPIAIDNRLYIDGGARFLIFGDAIGPIIDSKADFYSEKTGNNISAPLTAYMIINGDQAITPKCGKIDCPDDLAGYDYWSVDGARDNWNLLGLVERTVDVLKTQVGEFSESEIRIRAYDRFLEREGFADRGVKSFDVISSGGAVGFAANFGLTSAEQARIGISSINSFENYDLKYLKIEPETLDYVYKGKTCAQWREYDEKEIRNLQFHINYMRCMIEAGKDVIKEDGWE